MQCWKQGSVGYTGIAFEKQTVCSACTGHAGFNKKILKVLFLLIMLIFSIETMSSSIETMSFYIDTYLLSLRYFVVPKEVMAS